MRSHWRPILAVFGLLMLPLSAQAQQLQTGTWTGTITPPNTESAQATYNVRMSGDTLKITIMTPFGDLDFSDIKVQSDRITFTFIPGTPVNCTLMLREDKSYAGDCVDSDGDTGVLVMVPPAGDVPPDTVGPEPTTP